MEIKRSKFGLGGFATSSYEREELIGGKMKYPLPLRSVAYGIGRLCWVGFQHQFAVCTFSSFFSDVLDIFGIRLPQPRHNKGYAFDLNLTMGLDAARVGNETRFCNHKYSPENNCGADSGSLLQSTFLVTTKYYRSFSGQWRPSNWHFCE